MLENLLTSSIDVYTTGVSTTTLGNTQTEVVLYSNIAAAVQPLRDSMKLMDDGRKIIVDYMIYTNRAIATTPSDRIVWQNINMKINNTRDMCGLGRVWQTHASVFVDGA